MKVYIANLGERNAFWPICKSENVLTLETTQRLFRYWKDRDREGWIAWAKANERMINGQPAIPAVASRWYNLITIFFETTGDFWVHREGEHLYWTESISGSVNEMDIPDPSGKSRPYLLLKRPTLPWTNRAKDGRQLLWRSLHSKAHHFLQTEATYQEIANDRDYKDYAVSLLNGPPLAYLHSRPEWKAALNGKSTVKTFSKLEITIYDAVSRIGTIVARADGRQIISTAKIKDLLVSREEMRTFLEKLYRDQSGLCALTNIPMLLNGDEGPSDLRLSVDRIDSAGHYEPHNVQLVCQFANFWKSNRQDSRFRELVSLIRSTDNLTTP